MIDATGRAAAERLARFDIELDLDDTNEWGWLDVTHTLTYLNALRWAWSADPSPQVLRGLFHAAWFVQWTGQFDVRGVGPGPAAQAAPDAPTPPRSARRSSRRDPEAAVALVDGYTGPRERAGAIADPGRGRRPLHGADHGGARGQDGAGGGRRIPGARRAGTDSAEPIAAAARFIASPKRERFVFQSTLEAIATLRGVPKPESDQVRPA